MFVHTRRITRHAHWRAGAVAACLSAIILVELILVGGVSWIIASRALLALGVLLLAARRVRIVSKPRAADPDPVAPAPLQVWESVHDPRLELPPALRRAGYTDEQIHSVLHRLETPALEALAEALLHTDSESQQGASDDGLPGSLRSVTRQAHARGESGPELALLDLEAGISWLAQTSPDRVSDWSGCACIWCGYDPSTATSVAERADLETAMRRALDEHEFRIHYQPIISLADRRVTELEARVRWQRPGHGLLEPIAFMPVAEASGLSLPIGWWTLEQACLQAQVLQQRHRSDQSLVMCVNISPRQFHDPRLIGAVEQAVRAAGIHPKTLKLEIMHAEVADDAMHNEGIVLSQLKEVGVQVAIDNFPCGGTYLAYLKRMRVDSLKFDSTFDNDLGQAERDVGMAISRSCVELAKALDIGATAMGVETPSQLAFLDAIGCDQGQGYLLAEPLAAPELETFLAAEFSRYGPLNAA